MEKRIHLFTNRKSIAVWLFALCILASAVVRIIIFAPVVHGAVWPQIVLPVIAAILLVLIVLLSGERSLYKTAIPVWLLGLGCVWELWSVLWVRPLLGAMACVCILFFCVCYTVIISGRIRQPWLLLPLYLLALGAVGCIHSRLCDMELPLRAIFFVLPDYLLILGMLVLLFGIKVHTDGQYHPTWGDRADGRLIRSIPAIDQIGPYIMVNRTGANNLFSAAVEITEMEHYIHRKRKEGMPGFGITHVIIAAYVRTIAKYPAINRFIAGQKLFSRGADISLSMTVKKELSLSSPDTVIKVHFVPQDTANDVYRKFNEKVEEVKTTPLDSSMDNTAGLLALIPGIVLKFVVWLLKTLDYFGLIPAFLLEISPFHGSAYFTSMASLGVTPVYHHLYDFGNVPVFCSFGRKRHETEIVKGETVERKYVDLKFNLDERICDGYYYASAIKYFLRILKHPDVLDVPPAAVEQDVP